MRVILSGGGTGGHIYPAFALIEELKKRDAENEILYVGKKGSLEEELTAKNHYDFETVRVESFPRASLNLASLKSLYVLSQGYGDAGKIIKRFKPDVVIGTGGYVCAPVLLKAQSMHIPTLVQEQNAYPGKATRLLAKRASSIVLSFEEAEKFFPKDRNIQFFGNPIRGDFTSIERKEAKKKLNMDINCPILLSMGGSGGQESTNSAIVEMLEQHENLPFHLIHITGKDHYQSFMEKVEKIPRENVTIINYSHEIPTLMAASDLIIASSSAMTLAEITAVGRPSILIPKEYTAGNHQYHNAVSFVNKGASVMIEEKDLNGSSLFTAIQDLLEDRDQMNAMASHAQDMGNIEATSQIVDEIYRIGTHD